MKKTLCALLLMGLALAERGGARRLRLDGPASFEPHAFVIRAHTNQQVQEFFDAANRQHFGGRLRRPEIRWDLPESSEADADTFCAAGRCVIRFSGGMRFQPWAYVGLVTLHEMAHIALWRRCPVLEDDHGPCFQREMLRLARRGAFRYLW